MLNLVRKILPGSIGIFVIFLSVPKSIFLFCLEELQNVSDKPWKIFCTVLCNFFVYCHNRHPGGWIVTRIDRFSISIKFVFRFSPRYFAVTNCFENLGWWCTKFSCKHFFSYVSFQEGNILSCDNDSKLLFIDYEYSCYNYRNFDITNHFLEWIATYEYGDTPGFGFDMNKFPSQEEQERFVHKYLTESGFEANSEAIQSACREILNEIPIFSLYSHLLWSSWGICVQFHNSATCSSDCMDYLSYSVGRLQMYHQTKTEIEKRKLWA